MKIAGKLFSFFAAAVLALGAAPALAQAYPTKPIKFVVGYPAGGGTDIIARIVAQKVGDALGQPIVIENKPGANAIIGAEYVSKQAPDGYTFYFGGSGEMVFNAGLYDKLPYDPLKDFVPVTMTASYEMVIAANPNFPAKNMKEVVAMAKQKPGSIDYSYGASVFHVATELFKREAGIEIRPVAYKGTAAATNAAVSGEVPLTITSYGPAVALIKAGKLKPLAMTGAKRSASMPDVPSTGEQGVPFDGLMWNGVFAPAGTPQPIIDKVYGAIKVALKDPELIKRFETLGIDTNTIGMPPAEFAAFFRADLAKKVKGIKAAGLKAG